MIEAREAHHTIIHRDEFAYCAHAHAAVAADGTWLVGDYGEGAPSSNSTLFLQSEFAIANVRWLTLDIARVVTRGQSYVEKPDLSKVDEIGFADLLPGSGHGWGGFVNVARFEVFGKAVKR